jgi:hypothetical protein
MKTKLSILTIVMLFSLPAFSQLEYNIAKDKTDGHVELYNRHFPGEKKISLSPNIITSPDFGTIMAGGLKFQVFLGKRLSLDADFVVGKHYLHGGPGIIAVPFWLLFFSQSGLESDEGFGFKDFLFMVVAGVLSFEHLSYHIPLKNDLEISPFVSFLRYKQYTPTEDINADGGQLSFATGIQMDRYFGRFFISPYAEYNIGYSDGISGFNAGVGFGISFPRAY